MNHKDIKLKCRGASEAEQAKEWHQIISGGDSKANAEEPENHVHSYIKRRQNGAAQALHAASRVRREERRRRSLIIINAGRGSGR